MLKENKGFKRKTFLRGGLMGLCDLIPGISAGTIAFITGIYERLINAIKGFSPALFYGLLLFILGKGVKKELRKNVRKIDLGFLIPLVLGIFTAILLFSRVMAYLLEHHFSFTMAFFVGLILASAKTIFDHIERHHSLNTVLALVGLAIGLSLAFLIPTTVIPSFGYVFLGGFLAISAMILPGISGSFVLLMLGLYEFMLGVINDFVSKANYLLAFVLGAIIGLFTVSRLVSHLFKKDKSKTLYFLLGLVVGGLSVPLRGIYQTIDVAAIPLIVHIVLFGLGIWAAVLVRSLAKKR